MSECKQCVEKDKTIAELQDSTHYAIGRAVHRLQQQNTTLREALERIVEFTEERFTHDVGCEALAKVGEQK